MRDLIKLVSTAGTGHYYTTDKNKKNTPDKLVFKKDDPGIRKHVDYKEAKIKQQAFFGPEKPALAGFFMSVLKLVRNAGYRYH